METWKLITLFFNNFIHASNISIEWFQNIKHKLHVQNVTAFRLREEFMVTREKALGRRDRVGKFGTDRYTLLSLKQITTRTCIAQGTRPSIL